MDRLEEMFGLEKIRHPIERVIIDQDRTQEALLRLDIVRCTPIGRGRRIGSELENVRIKCGHGLSCSLDFVVLGKWGGDRAPLLPLAEARTCLMPDSHNTTCEGRAWRLTDFSPAPARYQSPSLERQGKIYARHEPYPARRYRLLMMLVDLTPESTQHEIAQPDQDRAYSDSHQGVVGSNVVLRIERWLVSFLGHFGGLG